jgi:acyl-CoA thioesterase-2
MSQAFAALLSILDLERVEDNLFRGRSPQSGWQRVFGGQVIGQALVAAQRTVEADRYVHSLHCYFMRPGDPTIPIMYEVTFLRDGGSFSTRSVVAMQHSKAIFTLIASFQTDEDGFEHQIPMKPNIPGPKGLISDREFGANYAHMAPDHIRAYFERERPIEMKPTSLKHYLTREPLEPEQNVWVRAAGEVPDDRALQAAVLAYISDMTLLDGALFAHGRSVFDGTVQAASLDHAMWFHKPNRLNDWLLYSQDSPIAHSGRGFARGAFYTRQGELIASVAQEGLIRPREN